MYFLFPIIAAVLQTAWYTLDKVILSMHRITYRGYVGFSFPLLFLFSLIIFLIVRPPLDISRITPLVIIFVVVSAGLTIGSNLFFYHALDDDKLEEIDVVVLLSNIPVILYAGLLFADERNYLLMIPALVASGFVAWSHWEKRHFRIAKHTWIYFLWSLTLAPLNELISKYLLTVFHPTLLTLLRYGLTALVLGLLYRRFTARLHHRALALFLLTNFCGALSWILIYYSYRSAGVVYTTLILMLHPLLVYLSAVLFLKEPLHRKKTIAFAIVLVSIGLAQSMI